MVAAFLVANHGQIEEQQRIAAGFPDAAQPAFDLDANLMLPAAVHQDVEDGRQAVSVHAFEERGPPAGERRRDAPIVVEEVQLDGQRFENPDDLVRRAPAGERDPVGQQTAHGVGHFRSDVPHVVVVVQVTEEQREQPKLRTRRQTLQTAGDRSGRVRIARHDFQQQPFRGQGGFDHPAPQAFGALQVPGRKRETTLPPTLIGGLEETDGLQIQEPIVMGSTPAGLLERAFGLAVRVSRIVQGGQLQPGGRIVGKPVRHVLQDTLDPPLAGVVSPQQIEQKEVAVAIVGVGLETRQHQLDEDHPRVLYGPAEQRRQIRPCPGRQQFRIHGRAARARQRLQHARPCEGPILRPRKLHRQHVDERDGGHRIPRCRHHLLPGEEDAGRDADHPIGGQQAP